MHSAQTAAALENLAIVVYNRAASLPFMSKIPDPTGAAMTAFVTKTIAQHRAVLLAVAALLQNNLADQVMIPPDLAALPAAAGSVGFRDTFLPTDQARPASEGAVQ